MFDWLKNKVARVSNIAAAEELRSEFRLLDELPNAPRGLVGRMVNYVLTGEGENVLAELTTLQHTHLAVPLVSLRHNHLERKGLPELVKQLPQDPAVLVRHSQATEQLR